MNLLGISSGKIASIAFLFTTLLLALILSSMEFLKTNNTAEVPVFYEGLEHEEVDEEATEDADKKTEDEDEDQDEPESKVEGNTTKDKKIEGFEVNSNTVRSYTPFQ
jgi:hypothetical protein